MDQRISLVYATAATVTRAPMTSGP